MLQLPATREDRGGTPGVVVSGGEAVRGWDESKVEGLDAKEAWLETALHERFGRHWKSRYVDFQSAWSGVMGQSNGELLFFLGCRSFDVQSR